MEKLATAKRAAVLRCLIEGNSILGTSRITSVAKNTIIKFLEQAGEACSDYMDKAMVNLPCTTLQLDEIWSFVGCKEGAKKHAKGDHPGDVWTWTALCADTKLIPSWRVGDRSGTTAYAFCAELSKRFSGQLQITSDGHTAYRWAVGANFPGVDYAQLVKIYGKDEKGQDVVTGIKKVPMLGNPVEELISTSYVERSNLTIRMGNRRFTRLTNAFSKKVDNHCHMLAVSFMHYNFCRKHSTIKTAPAVKAGVADHVWTLEEVVDMIDAFVAEKERLAFEEAFTVLKFTPQRTVPKTFPPQKPKTPWYLDVDSGGPNPAVRRPGVAYESDLS